MSKITGIKSVDFKITAFGHGVVNWNGPTTLSNEGKTVDNHTLPKLRGYTNLTGKIKEETGYQYKKEATDINFKETPLYISQNCIRHHLFREQAFDLHFAGEKNIDKVLASLTGLIRGYVVPASQCKRTSPLLIEDFVDQLGNGNFEQMGRSGSKKKETNKKGEESSNSFFSKTTFGDTQYISYGSISIEQLQFISLDNKFDRCAMIINDPTKVNDITQKIQDFIKSLDPARDPKVTFHENYVRKGTIYEKGECGILLDNTAIDILVNTTIERIQDLTIRQAKGYMYVDSIEIDYNDSNKMMRIKRSPHEIESQLNTDYAIYFEAK
ncbi:type I-Fv CRISPR-associated protein Cas7fv [Pasteurella skyensis]|uniref:Type I-Fv CRISPR-associated protein Cas7fv n=1 Tax=Phocoenobacter skyensis TaxID=97481 RepID=A0AAJ6NDK6_9PAST|nr:type I-Fv CRISPR-associated protein Cas7fv [Pasteurella skyensis]MDP8170649.1 type I-Fv CRISPR-associated protein Cas7fv [Pasteurella skyensis]MDP8174807.1 type I-Fv CRISPR-associated protein Cas7fv [Pasteurella skyensis]